MTVTKGNTQSKKTQIAKKQFLDALEKALGVVTQASKVTGIARKTHYEWLQKDPEYKKAVDDLPELVLDFAESKLHGLINEGNITAVIFFLKTQGRSRGYIERQEFYHEGKPGFVITENKEDAKKVMGVIHKHNERKRKAS